jgi:hemin uptake protein HemP
MNQLPDNPGHENDGGRPPHAPSEHPLIWRSSELLQGRREVWIEHGSDMYRLRLTSAGKLYLTK